MTDSPYPLDFFDRITDVQWAAGDWLYVLMNTDDPDQAHETGEIDFPDVSGGTPGFHVDNALNFPRMPYTISQPNLTAQFRALAGAKLTGFAVCGKTSATWYFFKCGGLLRPQFEVRVTGNVPDHDTGFITIVGLAPKGGFTAGAQINGFDGGLPIDNNNPLGSAAGSFNSGSSSLTFFVDTKARSVTGP